MSGRNHHRRRQERKTKITVTPEEHGMAMAAVMLAIGHEDFAEDLRPHNYELARDALLYGKLESRTRCSRRSTSTARSTARRLRCSAGLRIAVTRGGRASVG